MSSRAGFALAAAIGVLGGCATPPSPVERAAPMVVAPAPMPPLGPVEPKVVPGALPAGVVTPAATTTVPEPAPEPAVTAAPTEPTEEQQLASLLSDLQRYGAMNTDEVRREQNAITQLLSRQQTDFNRIRLAVLHTLSKLTPQDDQRAVQLLDAVVKNNPGSPAAKQLAAVVQVQVAERMRAVRDEQQKADAAVKKLEALRNMERDLLRDRVRGGGAGAGG
jgi:hypothetical protein